MRVLCLHGFLVGCLERFELSASRATIWRANQLRHRHHMRPKGLEPPAHCLEGSCSIQLSYWRVCMDDPTDRQSLWMRLDRPFKVKLERVKGIEPSYPAWKAGVLPLNYTRVSPYLTDSAWLF